METIKQYTLSKEQFIHNQKTWSKYISDKTEGRPQNHLLVALIYGTDPFKAFAPLKNEAKIVGQGRSAWSALESAAYALENTFTFRKSLFADAAKADRYKEKPEVFRLSYGPEPFFYVSEAMIDELLPKIKAISQGIKERQT